MASQTVSAQKGVVTKKPTGLSIARSGANFTCTWKIHDKDYDDGQAAQWRPIVKGKPGAWVNIANVGKKDTKASCSVTLGNYHPTKPGVYLTGIEFRVRGNRKKYETGKGDDKKTVNPAVSEWAYHTYNIKVPNATQPTATLSTSATNITTFSWSASDSGANWVTGVYWQSMLVKNCNETDGSKLNWTSSALGWQTSPAAGAGLAGSKQITEDTAVLAQGSYTRWFRLVVRGPAGPDSSVIVWKYAKHIYAQPKQAINRGTNVTTISGGGGLVTVKWEAPTSAANPNAETKVQYVIATPAAGLVCPSNAGWQDANVSADTSGQDAAAFAIANRPGEDECLWTRVNTKWDSNTTYGAPALAAVGTLKAPTGLSVSSDPDTYRATITATNASQVPDSFLVVTYITEGNPGGAIVGIIPHGQTSVTVQCPAWGADPVAFGVYAAQGSYTATPRADGVSSYAVTARMRSSLVTDGGSVPVAPGNVILTTTDKPGTIRVTFDWAWQDATSAEISWADHDDAWESTDEPTTYVINNTHASRWNISGLETGITWYVRVRLIRTTGEASTYGAYSEIVSIDLSSAPAIPAINLSSGVITTDGAITASWSYATTDGTTQAYAEVAEIVNGDYIPIAHAETAQYVTIHADDPALNWSAGETHALAVRVVSASGHLSDDWSAPAYVYIAEKLNASIVTTNLVPQTIVIGNVSRNINALTAMPLTLTVTGAGAGGTTSVVVERAESYHVARPDESDRYGFEGESIAVYTQVGESAITITADDLVGSLDDGAQYRIIATVSDGLGQTATDTKEFEVHWSHQAIIPNASVVIDDEAMISKLTPIAPTGTAAGDTCDIYRLSVDKPVLIYPGAQFGTTYVDPFPTIGEFGGHRFVFRTTNGDYITEDDELAFLDTGADEDDTLDTLANIIDFGSGRVILFYEIDLSNTWKKDFTETQYLGGSVQGDWNPAVSRATSLSAVGVRATDQDTIESMRRLAEHPGICHIRTKDGSSFAADVQVKEDYKQANDQKLVYFSLSITRVDPEGYDGLTLAEWEQTQQEDE